MSRAEGCRFRLTGSSNAVVRWVGGGDAEWRVTTDGEGEVMDKQNKEMKRGGTVFFFFLVFYPVQILVALTDIFIYCSLTITAAMPYRFMKRRLVSEHSSFWKTRVANHQSVDKVLTYPSNSIAHGDDSNLLASVV